MSGSIRQRGSNSWEIRVYSGTDPETGQRRQLSRTVRGSRTQAQRELRALAAFANVGPCVAGETIRSCKADGAKNASGSPFLRLMASSKPFSDSRNAQ